MAAEEGLVSNIAQTRTVRLENPWYSTVQYSAVQYSTVQYSQYHDTVHKKELVFPQVTSTSGDDADVEKPKVKESQNSGESHQFQGF